MSTTAGEERPQIDVAQAKPLERREHRVGADEGDVRPAHDAQVDRVERDHGEDAGEQVQDAEAQVEERRHQPGERAGGDRDRGGQERIDAVDDQRRRHRGPEREAAVDRQIGEVQDAERQEHAEGDETEHQPDLDRAQEGDDVHACRDDAAGTSPPRRAERGCTVRAAMLRRASGRYFTTFFARAIDRLGDRDAHLLRRAGIDVRAR